jgi:hypothetical protein
MSIPIDARGALAMFALAGGYETKTLIVPTSPVFSARITKLDHGAQVLYILVPFFK